VKKWICFGVGILMLTWSSISCGAVTVFVSIPPQRWLVNAVGGDRVAVEILVRPGQDPHTFEPLPRQVAALSRAGIWYLIGLTFEEPLQRKIAAVAPGLMVIDMGRDIEKLPMTESGHYQGSHNGSDHDHHGEGPLDPHIWLSPPNLQIMAGTVAKTLAEIDPANREEYRRNLEVVNRQLTLLDEQLKTVLAPYRGASFFVYHPTFGYFAHTYGLKQDAVEIGGKSPAPRQLASLIAKAKAQQMKVIFVQPQFDPKAAQAIAAAIGGRVVPLDALAEDVPANLLTMATRIEEGLKK